jgi:hypothetical protein
VTRRVAVSPQRPAARGYTTCFLIGELAQRTDMLPVEIFGPPDDNARAESFFKTLKREEVYPQHYQTFAEAERNLARFIDDVYN